MKKLICILLLTVILLTGCALVELNSVENQGDLIIFNYSDGHKLYEVSTYKTVQYKQDYVQYSRYGSNTQIYELFFNMPDIGKVYKASVSKDLYDTTIPGEGLFVKYKYTTKGKENKITELINFEIITSEGKVPLPIDVD